MSDKNLSTVILPKSTHPSFIDLEGQRFGRLVVLGFVGMKRGNAVWLCQCDCGTHKPIKSYYLRRSKKARRDCGCAGIGHGMSHNPTYISWHGLKTRCYNQRDEHYARYGARGIRVCERWRRSFKNFLADMGERPDGMTVERIDNDGHYEPDNCRWATPEEQSNNRQVTRLLTFNGKTQSISMWAREVHMSYNTLFHRVVHRNWGTEKALTEPIHLKHSSRSAKGR